jgi:hypothetical protein
MKLHGVAVIPDRGPSLPAWGWVDGEAGLAKEGVGHRALAGHRHFAAPFAGGADGFIGGPRDTFHGQSFGSPHVR